MLIDRPSRNRRLYEPIIDIYLYRVSFEDQLFRQWQIVITESSIDHFSVFVLIKNRIEISECNRVFFFISAIHKKKNENDNRRVEEVGHFLLFFFGFVVVAVGFPVKTKEKTLFFSFFFFFK